MILNRIMNVNKNVITEPDVICNEFVNMKKRQFIFDHRINIVSVTIFHYYFTIHYHNIFASSIGIGLLLQLCTYNLVFYNHLSDRVVHQDLPTLTWIHVRSILCHLSTNTHLFYTTYRSKHCYSLF